MNNEMKAKGSENQIHQWRGSGGIGGSPFRSVVCGIALATTMLAGYWAWAQNTPPVLTIAPTGTNQLLITITNGVDTGNYELWWTPVLADPAYPWTAAVIGNQGQTNFTVNIGPYSSGFFRVVVDTNTIPLWEAADPNNPSAGILTVFIDSPANGSVVQ